MVELRCTNCGSNAVKIKDQNFAECASCGSVFSVKRGEAFAKVEVDSAKEIALLRKSLKKALKIQEDSSRARDYQDVKNFAIKILSILPDDFTASYYNAIADLTKNNDTAFMAFLTGADITYASDAEIEEVCKSLAARYSQPKYKQSIADFLSRTNPQDPTRYNEELNFGINKFVEKKRLTQICDRDVFICHRSARPDCDIANEICTQLENDGLKCWIAPRNILAGSQNYEDDIENGVKQCRLLLFVSSYKSIYSEDCEKEIKHAVIFDKAFFSYRIDDTPYDGISQKHIASAVTIDASDDPYAHIQELKEKVKIVLNDDLKQKELLSRRRETVNERIKTESVLGYKPLQANARDKVVSNKIKRVYVELTDGEFDKASELIDELLDVSPEDGEVWWLHALCELKAKNQDDLINSGVDYRLTRGYKNALKFGYDLSEIDALTNEILKKEFVLNADSDFERAEEYLKSGDFDALSKFITRRSPLFADKVYPFALNYRSQFHWLKLWATLKVKPFNYDKPIKTEPEYKAAVLYANPEQLQYYNEVEATIQRNINQEPFSPFADELAGSPNANDQNYKFDAKTTIKKITQKVKETATVTRDIIFKSINDVIDNNDSKKEEPKQAKYKVKPESEDKGKSGVKTISKVIIAFAIAIFIAVIVVSVVIFSRINNEKKEIEDFEFNVISYELQLTDLDCRTSELTLLR